MDILGHAFTTQRIILGCVSLWAPIKTKVVLKCKESQGGKDCQRTTNSSLFPHLLVMSRSQHDIDLCEILGKYEFSAVP